MFSRAAELAGEGGSDFAKHSGALSRATAEVIGPSGKVDKLGEVGGHPIFVSQRSRVGIFPSGQGTLLVRPPAGEAVQELGLYR